MLGEAQEVILRRGWRQGMQPKAIAEQIGRSVPTVYWHVRRLNLPKRDHHQEDAKRNQQLSTPMNKAMLEAVRKRARGLGISAGEYNRRLIEWDLRSLGIKI